MSQESGGSQSDSEKPVLACEDLVRRYQRTDGGLFDRGGDRPTVTALDGVSLSVSTGEFTVITGASGSGKSTLLHLLAAIDTPTSGTVAVAGQETTGLSAGERAALRLNNIGIVFQRFHLLPSLTARGNVTLPLIERGISRSSRIKQADHLLERVGLADRAEHTPGQLSGGEQQRVAIARALVNQPQAIVADEPTGELDTETGEAVLDLFADIAEDRAIIIASHDPQVIDRADRIITLQDGCVVDE